MPIFAPFFMQVHYKSNQLPVFRNAVVTIGTFDGVHRGHRQILDKLIQEAKKVNGETVIITFDPHPRKIVNTQQPAIKLINTLHEKIELLRQIGIDHLVIVDFTPEFANQHADDYIKDFLVGKFQPHTIIIGYDHRFGKNREGDFRLLERMAPVFNYQLKEIPQHVLNEAGISSTRIREAILKSDIETANELLSYHFFFSGEVVHGDKLGRQLGYPTVNLDTKNEEKIIAGNGIYAVYVDVNNERKKGMMSIGLRPTVGGTKRVIEVNIFDFNADVYGQTLTVTIKKHLRAEVKFNSLEELTAQMAKDKIESLAVL
jgi:riboflavin kinase / FMN adenylyltransferase